MKLRHAAKAVIRRRTDGKYLVLWSSEWPENPRRSHQPDLPGGIVEAGESIEQGLLREVQEEAGFLLEESELVLAHAHMWDEADESTVFLVYFSEIEDAEVVVSWEHERYAWLTADELLHLEMRQPYPALFQHMNKVGLIV